MTNDEITTLSAENAALSSENTDLHSVARLAAWTLKSIMANDVQFTQDAHEQISEFLDVGEYIPPPPPTTPPPTPPKVGIHRLTCRAAKDAVYYIGTYETWEDKAEGKRIWDLALENFRVHLDRDPTKEEGVEIRDHTREHSKVYLPGRITNLPSSKAADIKDATADKEFAELTVNFKRLDDRIREADAQIESMTFHRGYRLREIEELKGTVARLEADLSHKTCELAADLDKVKGVLRSVLDGNLHDFVLRELKERIIEVLRPMDGARTPMVSSRPCVTIRGRDYIISLGGFNTKAEAKKAEKLLHDLNEGKIAGVKKLNRNDLEIEAKRRIRIGLYEPCIGDSTTPIPETSVKLSGASKAVFCRFGDHTAYMGRFEYSHEVESVKKMAKAKLLEYRALHGGGNPTLDDVHAMKDQILGGA